MIYVIMVILIAPIIGLMIRNGICGNGYQLNFRIPPKGSPQRFTVRIGLAIYAALLFAVVITSVIQDDAIKGNTTKHTVILILFYLVGIPLVLFFIRFVRKGPKE